MAGGQVWTIGAILKWSEQYFGSQGAETPRLEPRCCFRIFWAKSGYTSMCISSSR